MCRRRKKLLAGFLAIALATYPLYAMAEETDNIPKKEPITPVAMTIDTTLARPLGLVSTVIGSAIFVVSLPFSALGGNTPEAWNSLVASPSKYTFHRPLGEFNQEDPNMGF